MVHVLIPVFNRIAMTRNLLQCLSAQVVDETLRLIVIDDGSTDGTAEYLETRKEITIVKGNGYLWWGGAIELGLQVVLEDAHPSDWVLLVNNDTQFNSNFIQVLIDTARANKPAAVGSVICDIDDPDQIISIGAILDTWRLNVSDKLAKQRLWNQENGVYIVDALSGRGTLYPLNAFYMAGTMKPLWLPHYLADYELAIRVRKAGFKLMVTEKAATLSANEFGNSYKAKNLIDKFFSVRSPYYLPAILYFWWCSSSTLEKLSLAPRILYLHIVNSLRVFR
jgi:N-acetylglucosaminyl-diphospho-decaprenol L-rhamnosyltransferase